VRVFNEGKERTPMTSNPSPAAAVTTPPPVTPPPVTPPPVTPPPVTPPPVTAVAVLGYDDILEWLLALAQTRLTVSYNGLVIPPDTSVGSDIRTFCEQVALVGDALFARQSAIEDALDLMTAGGADLERLVALVTDRIPGAHAIWAVKVSRRAASGSAVPVAAGKQVYARDRTGNPTISGHTLADPLLSTVGQQVAAIIPANQTWSYGLAQADVAGVAGNIAPGQLASAGDLLPGVDTIGNPPLTPPGAPAVSIPAGQGAGTVVYQYQLVARGVTGATTPGPIGQTAQGPPTLSPVMRVTISYNPTGDGSGEPAAAVDVLKVVPIPGGTSAAPQVALLGTIVPPAVSLDDTGQATTTYALPTQNTANAGVGGLDPEPDDSDGTRLGLRQRAPTVLAQSNTGTEASVVGAVAAVPGVLRAYGVDAQLTPLAGMPGPGQALVQVVTAATPPPPDVVDAINAAVAHAHAFGIVVSIALLTPVPLIVSYTFAPVASAPQPVLLIGPIDAAIAAYLGTLGPGDAARWSLIGQAISSVSGVYAVTTVGIAVAGGGGVTNADLPGQVGVVYGPGSYNATVDQAH